MGSYAKVRDGVVNRVIVADEDFISQYVDNEVGKWIQTSYNTKGGIHYDQSGNPSADQSKALRKNYAGIGYSYDKDRDAFIPPQPYPSWTLDETSCLWKAPVAMPSDGKMYDWDEDSGAWVEVTAA